MICVRNFVPYRSVLKAYIRLIKNPIRPHYDKWALRQHVQRHIEYATNKSNNKEISSNAIETGRNEWHAINNDALP